MAKKDEIQKQNIDDSNKSLSEQINLVSDLNDRMALLVKNAKEKFTQDKLSENLTKKAVTLTQSLLSEYNSIKDVEKDIAKNQKLQNDVARQQLSLEKTIGEEGKERIKAIKSQSSNLSENKKILEDLRKQEELGIKGAAKKAKALAQQVYEDQKSLLYNQENLSIEEKQLMILEETSQVLQGNNDFLKTQLEYQENLVKSQTLFTSSLIGANKVLEKLGFGDLGKKLGLDAAAKKAKDLTYELTDGGKKALGAFGKMRVGIAAFGAALKSALGPLALIGMATSLFSKFKEMGKEALDFMVEINTETVNLTRELGLSASNGAKVAGQARAIGGAMGMTHEQATAAASAIYGQIQGTEQLGAETMKTFMKLNVHGGISGDVLGKIYNISKLTGKEAGHVAEEIASQAQESLKSLKVNVSMKSIMESVSKVSSRVALNFQGSGKAITSAVVQAKKLGLEMEQVENIANSLLNIEDSIAAEMEAELLTGKELNLEKAREAALNGDNAALMSELAAQGIDAAEFSKMNRIQQDALGKALGMNGDSLADMLSTQKKNEASNQDTLSLQKDSIAAMTSMASLAEAIKNNEDARKGAMGPLGEMYLKFEHAMTKIATALMPVINALFTELWKIIWPVFEGVEKWLTNSNNIKLVTDGIKSTFSVIGEVLSTVWEIMTPLFNALVKIGEFLLPKIYSLFLGLKPVFLFLAETIGSILGTVVDLVSNITTFIGKIFDTNATFTTTEKIVGSIAAALFGMIAVSKTILGIQTAIKGIQVALNAEKRAEFGQMVKNQALAVKDFFKSMGSSIAKIFGGFAQIPFGLGIPLAIAAAATLGTMAYKFFNKGDDVFSEGGYGKRTLLGPEGAIQLNNNDDVVAGTDLFKNKQGGGGGGSDSVVAELQRVSALLQQILSKEGAVMIDGNKVGTTLALSNYKQQ